MITLDSDRFAVPVQDQVDAVVRMGASAAFEAVPQLLAGARHESFELEPVAGGELLREGPFLGGLGESGLTGVSLLTSPA